MYLGGRLKEHNINGIKCWTLTSKDYLDNAIENVYKRIQNTHRNFPNRLDTVIASKYCPELDSTPELGPKDITMFQELIGILRGRLNLDE